MTRGKASALVIFGTSFAELEAALIEHGCEVERAEDLESGRARLASALFDVVLVPLSNEPTSSAKIASLREVCSETPIVAVGADQEQLTHAALRAGASEYLVWPTAAAALTAVLDAAMTRGRAAADNAPSPTADSGLIGSSPQLRAAREAMARVAPGSATVLVRGETGTGKELAARAIHTQSQRGKAPFVKVHTPAVPDALLESELFGYEKGAFTGASTRKPGRVELAESGTLFLDEIGDVSPTMQSKLLRLIQDREFERLGGTRTLRADIRIVAATHRDLEHLVETGAFREDLFYRLNVVSIWLPPLRARREDIALIAQHYLEVFCAENYKRLRFDDAALRILEAERWPGNVRQLVNVVERLVVLSTADRISAQDVRRGLDEQLEFLTQAAPGAPAVGAPSSVEATPPALREEEVPVPATTALPAPALHFSSAVRPLKEDLRRTELRAITKALHYAKGNRALAARLLGVSRRTLYTKLEEHGIE